MKHRTTASSVSAGIFLISLGVLIMTGWWWPGIMFAIGLAAAARLAFNGRYLHAVIVFALFAAIPVLSATIPWNLIGPLVLISLGAVIVVKALVIKEEKA